MWYIEYYIEHTGRQPVAEWLDDLDKGISAHMYDKIVRLQENGLILIDTSMMKPLKGYGENFYELIFSGYRIALYNDKITSKFILLHGFKKKRMRESREIETAYARLLDYQSRG